MKRQVNSLKRKQHISFVWKVCRHYLLFVVIMIFVTYIGFPYVTMPNRKYVSAGSAPQQQEVDFPRSGVTYCYYLDVSPSMRGFFNVDGSMSNLAQILRILNSRRNNKLFYYCGTDIMNVGESSYYDFMDDVSWLDKYYRDKLYQAGEIEPVENTESETAPTMELETETDLDVDLEQLLMDFDLSGIFTDQYSDDRVLVNDENTVNVIISDFNFMSSDTDYERHNANLDQFARALAGNAMDSNVGIYRIMSRFQGYIYDEYRTDANTEQKGGSFFLIVFSPNDVIYDAYVEELEKEFDRKGILAGDRYEIRNDRLNGEHEREADPQLMTSAELIHQFTNFNRNNGYFKVIDEQAVGLQIVRDESGISYVQIPVMSVELSGYYGEEETRNSIIDARYQLFDAGIREYRECENVSGIRGCTGTLRRQSGNWYLYLDLEIDQNLNGMVGSLFKRYCVVDIWFSLKEAGYSLPSWVDEINESEPSEDFSKKLNIRSLFEQIGDRKASAFESETDDYMKQIGNARVYISY